MLAEREWSNARLRARALVAARWLLGLAAGTVAAAGDIAPASAGLQETLPEVAPVEIPPVGPGGARMNAGGGERAGHAARGTPSTGSPGRRAPAASGRTNFPGGGEASGPPGARRGWTIYTDPSADAGDGDAVAGFCGLGGNAHAPPHPDIGVGPHHVVQVVNDEFCVFNKCGQTLFATDINTYLGDEGEFFDPRVAFDPWNDRWVILFLFRDADARKSETVFIVSKNSVPPGAPGELGCWVYRVNAVKNAGGANASFVETCDLGFSASAVHAAGDWRRFSGSYRYAALRTLDKATLYNGLPVTPRDDVNITHADGSRVAPVAAEMQWSQPGAEMFFVSSRASGGSTLSLFRLDDPNGAHVLTRKDIDVPAYGLPGFVPQAGGAAIDVGDCRLRNCVLTANLAIGGALRLYCGTTTATGDGEPAMARMYVLDPLAGTLLDTIDYAGAAGQHYFLPAVGADYAGWSWWVFGRSAADEFLSSRVAEVREVWPGVFVPSGSVALQSGAAPYSGPAVWGWAFGAQLDWGDYYFSPASRVWLVGQHARGDGAWGTRIGWVSAAEAGVLDAAPTDRWDMVGFEGGPFSPAQRVVNLTNNGATGVAWSLTAPLWVQPEAWTGDVYPSEAAALHLHASEAAEALAPGEYDGVVRVSDCGAGGASFDIPVGLRVRRRGELAVTPDERLVAVGPEGGPFAPEAKTYLLTNVGEETVAWSASQPSGFLTVQPTSGLLAPGESAALDVALTDKARQLEAGQYDTAVAIENTTNGRGGTTRLARVLVQRAAELRLTPDEPFVTAGHRGGPFDPALRTYVLTNTGQQAMEFVLLPSTKWVSLFPASGLLNEEQSVNVVVSIGAEAASLSPGSYDELFTALNLTTGMGDTSRAVRLTVLPPPCAPCDTDCDGSVNGADIEHFVSLLGGGSAPCAACAGDTDGNGTVNGFDLGGFMECLTLGGVLTVTPASRFETVGPEGGPFVPPSTAYALTNSGYAILDWQASQPATHFDVAPGSGSLQPGQTALVVVSNNSQIDGLTPGVHDSTLTLTNATNGRGTTSRFLRAVVKRRAEALFLPDDGFASAGPRGGPFAPPSKTYVLTNAGEADGYFTLTADAPWVSVFPPYAALSGGQSVGVTLSITSAALSLTEGTYDATLRVVNETNGLGDTTRPISLTVTPPAGGELRVSPSDKFTTTGPQGGPFEPGAKVYTLENILDGPLDWTATDNASWISVSPASGTLSGHASVNVTVSVNADAGGLAPGTYDRTLTVTNVTNGLGNTTRTLRTIVQRRAEAGFTPAEGYDAAGPRGGPFSPPSKVYVLKNIGEAGGYFTLALDAAWVSVFPPYAELSGGQSVNITLSLTDQAIGLSEGTYSATLSLTNETNGLGDTTRPITLTVTPPTAGELRVSPTDRYATIGPQGGPFSPGSKVYTLTNILDKPLDWSMSGAPAWIDASPASGTLAGGGSVDVTVAVNTQAGELAPGVYDRLLTFNNLSNGLGTTTRLTRVTVLRKGELSLSPADGFSSAGPAGGPFTPASKTYVLTNVGEAPADFVLSADAGWVTLFPASGMLNGNQSVNVVVSINAAANQLPPGGYAATVSVHNATNGLGDTARPVTLTVGP